MTKTSEVTAGPWKREGLTFKTSRGVIMEFPRPQQGGVFDCQQNADFVEVAVNACLAFPDPLRAAQEIGEAFRLLAIFAKFADHRRAVLSDTIITNGSPYAKDQLKMGHCYAAEDLFRTLNIDPAKFLGGPMEGYE